jgi:sarcosine oxidase subunit gamma
MGDDFDVMISPVECCGRWSLRAAAQDEARLAEAWGAGLPGEPLGAHAEAGRAALRLGPDEWLLLSNDPGAADDLWKLCPSLPLSLVDISHRQLSFSVTGERSVEVIGAGCPLDLSEGAFPPGRATRTLYGKAEIVLWRLHATSWRIEVWRSFTDYLLRRVRGAAADRQDGLRLRA